MLKLHSLFYNIYYVVNLHTGASYKDSMKQQSLSDEPKSGNKSILGQRVMSAKMLRFKQLQNQLADAHYHLNVSMKIYQCLNLIPKIFI